MADVDATGTDAVALKLVEGALDTTISGDAGVPIRVSEAVAIFGQMSVAEAAALGLAEATPSILTVLTALESCGIALSEVAGLAVFVQQMETLGVGLTEQLATLEVRQAVADLFGISLEEATSALALLVLADSTGVDLAEVAMTSQALLATDTLPVGLLEREAVSVPPRLGRVIVATVRPVRRTWAVRALVPQRTVVAA